MHQRQILLGVLPKETVEKKMGYIDKTSQTVTAHFTKRGRELLANALSGVTDDSYIITQFALGDDEIDYSLYDESLSANFRGRVIENMPLLESFVNQEELMNYYITDAPDIALASMISNIPAQITLQGQGDIVDVIPLTENFSFYDEETQSMQDWEEYTFVLTLDNLAEMYDINTPPISDFTYTVTDQGIPLEGSPPMANFTWNSN